MTRARDRLGAVGHAELVEHIADVLLDRIEDHDELPMDITRVDVLPPIRTRASDVESFRPECSRTTRSHRPRGHRDARSEREAGRPRILEDPRRQGQLTTHRLRCQLNLPIELYRDFVYGGRVKRAQNTRWAIV
jgi:hypothetical protein